MTEDWRAKLRLDLEDLVDEAVVSGVEQADVFAAIEEELSRLRRALDHDPDPADDTTKRVVDDPANDWPGAT
jgi:hypothetical protein